MTRHPAARLLVLVLLLAPASLSPAASLATAAVPLDLPAYITELEHWDAAVCILEQHPEQWEEMRRSLAPAWSVAVDGQRFEVSTHWLDDALQTFGRRPDQRDTVRRSMQARLTALHDEAVALSRPSQGVPTAAAAARLNEILSHREFRVVRDDSLWRRIQEIVSGWLIRLLELILGPIARNPWSGRILIWLAIAAAFVLVVVIIRRVWMRAPREQTFDPGGLPGAVEGSLAWRAKAAAAASHGNYAEAVRCAYWAAVVWLGEAGVWQTDLARTPREYLRLLPAGHARSAPLAALTRRFEEVWYRRQTGTLDEFQDALMQLEALGCPLLSGTMTEKS